MRRRTPTRLVRMSLELVESVSTYTRLAPSGDQLALLLYPGPSVRGTNSPPPNGTVKKLPCPLPSY